MLIDVTYFNNGLFLVLYHNHDIGYIQLYRETEKEKLREIEDYDLQQKMTLLNFLCTNLGTLIVPFNVLIWQKKVPGLFEIQVLLISLFDFFQLMISSRKV